MKSIEQSMKVDVNIPSLLEKEDVDKDNQQDELNRGEDEVGKGNDDEDTQNPLDHPMDSMSSMEAQAPVDDTSLKKGQSKT